MKKANIVALLVAAAFAVGPLGCMDNDVSLFIYNVQGPKLQAGEEEGTYYCVWNSADDPVPCMNGLLDIGNSFWSGTPEGAPYLTLYLFVANGLPTNVDVARGQLNTHDVRLDRVEARFRWLGDRSDIEGDANLAPLMAPLMLLEQSNAVAVQYAAESILPAASADSSTVTMSLLEVRAIPAEVGSLLASTMQGQPVSTLAKITMGLQLRLIGSTTGGQHVESADFSFPVGFCSGCLEGTSGCFTGQEPYTTRCFAGD